MARQILEKRGAAPRNNRNTLVFLAPDQARLQDWDEAVRVYLAWESIVAEADTLDLSASQRKQAQSQQETANTTVDTQLPETYCWLLVPSQPTPASEIEWQTIRLHQGDGPLAKRVFQRLQKVDLVLPYMAGSALRLELDKVPLWDGNHIRLDVLADYFAKYLYLPRVCGPSVLTEAVVDGVSLLSWRQDTFAYADRFDEATGRYVGLKAGQQIQLQGGVQSGLVVRPEVAAQQSEQEAAPPSQPGAGGPGEGAEGQPGEEPLPPDPASPKPAPPPPRPKRFHGAVVLDPQRASRDAGRIHEEILAHLHGQPGAQLEVSLEIRATLPQGADEKLQRIVNENCRTLKFRFFGFEAE